MNKFILIFSMISFLSANTVYAQTPDIASLTPEEEELINSISLSDDDIDIDFSEIDIDEGNSSSSGNIYVNTDHKPVSSSQGPVLKVPSNTFPLTRSGMMVSPTPIGATPQPTSSNVQDKAKISKDVSLTDLFDEGASAEIPVQESTSKGGETWLDKLRTSAESEIKGDGTVKSTSQATSEKDSSGLKSLVDDAKSSKNRRSNAAVFDISGAMLRMTPKQIEDVLTRRGYRKTNEKFEIPNFIKWRKEDECRAAGVVGYERLASCVVQSSKKENYQYLEKASYSKFDTQESIVITFTSNFTGNKAFKISYASTASNVTGNSQKAIYMRNIKVYDFWKKINQKYGAPDNKEDIMWGLGGNKPYMQAKTGKLLLEDPMLRELDYTRMSREDQKFINTSVYNF